MINLKHIKVLALAMSLPSLIIAISGIVYKLVQENIINQYLGIAIIVIVIFNTFYLMIKYVSKRKN